MTNKRKTGLDYRKEYNDLNKKMRAIDVRVHKRVLELGKIYPDAPIGSNSFGKDINKRWMELIGTDTKIYLIEKIEKWANKDKQLTLYDKKICD